MICRTCSRAIPDGLLACAICTRAASEKALREYQYAPLRKVMARLGKLTTRTIERTRHVQAFGAEQTYCGIWVSPQHLKRWAYYDPEELTGICDKCRDHLDRLIDEARRAW